MYVCYAAAGLSRQTANQQVTQHFGEHPLCVKSCTYHQSACHINYVQLTAALEAEQNLLFMIGRGFYLNVERRPHYLAILYKLGNHRSHNVDGNGKSHPCRGACVGEDCCVDANHPPLTHIPCI